ncbi:MAG: hypothetical protein ACREM1_00060 [Longimicrobiales bacterium]
MGDRPAESAAWAPTYAITPSIAEALMRIGEAQGAIDHRIWSPVGEEAIRQRAHVRSTHYSTAIEGNRLALAEAEQVVLTPTSQRHVVFAGRERDMAEVDH